MTTHLVSLYHFRIHFRMMNWINLISGSANSICIKFYNLRILEASFSSDSLLILIMTLKFSLNCGSLIQTLTGIVIHLLKIPYDIQWPWNLKFYHYRKVWKNKGKSMKKECKLEMILKYRMKNRNSRIKWN